MFQKQLTFLYYVVAMQHMKNCQLMVHAVHGSYEECNMCMEVGVYANNTNCMTITQHYKLHKYSYQSSIHIHALQNLAIQ